MINLALLKNLFSKLKPAAKALVPYADDAAKGLTTVGKTGGVSNLFKKLALMVGLGKVTGPTVATTGPTVADAADDVIATDDIKIGTNPAARTAVEEIHVYPLDSIYDEPYGKDGVKLNGKWYTYPDADDIALAYSSYINSYDDRPFKEYAMQRGISPTVFEKREMLDRILRGDRTYDAPVKFTDLKHPGANTAMGRWYAKQHPMMYKYPIGPNPNYSWAPIEDLKNPYRAITASDRLPF